MRSVTPRPRDDSAGVLSDPNSEAQKYQQEMGLEGTEMAAPAQTHSFEAAAPASNPSVPTPVNFGQLQSGTPFALQAGIPPQAPQAPADQHPAFAVHAALLQQAGLGLLQQQQQAPGDMAALAVSPGSPSSVAAAHTGAQSNLCFSGGSTVGAPSTLNNSGGSIFSNSDAGHPTSPSFLEAAQVAATMGFTTAPPPSAVATAAAATSAAVQNSGLDMFQQQQLAGAAATAQRTIAQRTAEQQLAAFEFQNAAATAGSSTDPVQRAQATAAAHHAKTAYEVAGMEVAAAQGLATQLQAASLGFVAAPVQQQQQPVATMPAASPQPPLSLPAVTAQQVQAMQQLQHATAALAASLPGSTGTSVASSHLDMLPVTAPPAQMHPTAASQQTAAATAAAAPLMQAAMSAKQTATQKTIETHAAAAAYQAASLQAGSTSDPMQHAMASMAAQQAAMTYHAAANEASNAASTAAQLEQAAAAAAVAATMATPMPLPASAPLAAHIATGAMLPQFGHQVTLPQQTLSMATPPALLDSMGLSSGGQYASSALSGFPGFSGMSQAGLPPQGMMPPPMHSVPGLQGVPPVSTLGLPATPSTFALPAAAVQYPVQQVQPVPAVPQVLPGMAGLHAGFGALPQTAPTASTMDGVSTTQSTLTQLPSGLVLSPLSSIAEAPASEVFIPPSPPSPPEIVKAVCSSGGSFVRGTSGTWDYDGGETRLVSLRFGCSSDVLFSTLERATSSLSDSSEQTSDFTPIIKYRLPSDPNVWVDLVDDDDVSMMFDEWEELVGAIKTSAGPGSDSGSVTSTSTRASPQVKLHIFVQWRPAASGFTAGGVAGTASEGAAAEDGATISPFADQQNDGSFKGGGSNEANNNDNGIQILGGDGHDDKTAPSPASSTKATTPNGNDQASTSREGHAERAVVAQKSARSRRKTQMDRLSSCIDLNGLVERMEIIDASDISLVRFLGAGSFGDVYLSKWRGCEVAVKCLNPALFFQGSEPGLINRAAVVDLIREADMLGSLRHPAVVWVYGLVLPDLKGAGSKGRNAGGGGGGDGSDSDGGGGDHGALSGHDLVDAIQSEAGAPSMMPGILRPPALVTEYMAGGSLKSALTRRADIVAGALTRVVLAMDASKGMEYLHSKQIVHFDLKSGNLLLGYRDRRPVCKVADFGLAREKTQTFCSGVTSQRGTLPWTAPEILRTPNNVTEKVDVFSFGIVMWELWTGREPYEGLNYHALMIQLANPEARLRPPIPGTAEWENDGADPPPELAPGWRALMESCWEENPEDRPSFTEIIKDLRGMVAAIKPVRGAAQRSGSSQVKK